MCDPISASIGTALVGGKAAATAAGLTAFQLGMIGASTTLGIASPVVSAIGQRQQAKAQMQFQEQQRQAAVQKQGLQRTSALLEQSQKVEAIKQQKGELFKMYRAAEATETARGAMAQTAAISNELKRQLGGELSRLERQEELYGMQYGLGMQQQALAGQQELLSLSQPIQTESPLVTSLKALSGGLSGASAGLDFASATRKRTNVGIGNKTTV